MQSSAAPRGNNWKPGPVIIAGMGGGRATPPYSPAYFLTPAATPRNSTASGSTPALPLR